MRNVAFFSQPAFDNVCHKRRHERLPVSLNGPDGCAWRHVDLRRSNSICHDQRAVKRLNGAVDPSSWSTESITRLRLRQDDPPFSSFNGEIHTLWGRLPCAHPCDRTEQRLYARAHAWRPPPPPPPPTYNSEKRSPGFLAAHWSTRKSTRIRSVPNRGTPPDSGVKQVLTFRIARPAFE